MLMLAYGGGRWAVSQKPKIDIIFPLFFRAIAVRTGPSSGVTILIRRPEPPSGVAPELLGNMNWGSLGGDFKEVHYSKMPGRTFVQKLFLLLAVEMR